MDIGCSGDAAVLVKKGLEADLRASSRSSSKPLFQFAAQTRTALPSGLPLGCYVREDRRFAAVKRAGLGRCLTGVRPALQREPARFFRRKNGGTPAGGTTQPSPAGRGRVSGRSLRSRQKKSLKPRGELARTFGFRLFFIKACPTTHPKAGFRESSREAFAVKSRLSNVPPHSATGSSIHDCAKCTVFCAATATACSLNKPF